MARLHSTAAIVLIFAVVAVLASYLMVDSRGPSHELDPSLERTEPVGPPLQTGDLAVHPEPAHLALDAATRTNEPDEPTMADQPLSADDLPFSSQWSELSKLAMKGHPTAACRLFVGASRCAFNSAIRDFGRQMETSLGSRSGRPDDELFVHVIARSQDETSQQTKECEGVDAGTLPSADDYLARAVSHMSARQKTLLAMTRADGTLVRLPREPDPVVRPGQTSDHLIPQFLADNNLRFLREGVAASDPLALEGLILVHAPGYLPGSRNGLSMAIPDPHRFAHYSLLMQTIYGPGALGPAVDEMLAHTLARMDATSLAQIEAEVAASAASWDVQAADPLTLQGPSVADAMPLCTQHEE